MKSSISTLVGVGRERGSFLWHLSVNRWKCCRDNSKKHLFQSAYVMTQVRFLKADHLVRDLSNHLCYVRPNKTLSLVWITTQSMESICMTHRHILYLSEARQLHHGRFRHIKQNANCQSKGGEEGGFRVWQGETGWDTGMFTKSLEQILSWLSGHLAHLCFLFLFLPRPRNPARLRYKFYFHFIERLHIQQSCKRRLV